MAKTPTARMTVEQRNNPQVLRICIDANCPECGWPERFLVMATGVFGCRKCNYVSLERDK